MHIGSNKYCNVKALWHLCVLSLSVTMRFKGESGMELHKVIPHSD